MMITRKGKNEQNKEKSGKIIKNKEEGKERGNTVSYGAACSVNYKRPDTFLC